MTSGGILNLDKILVEEVLGPGPYFSQLRKQKVQKPKTSQGRQRRLPEATELQTGHRWAATVIGPLTPIRFLRKKYVWLPSKN